MPQSPPPTPAESSIPVESREEPEDGGSQMRPTARPRVGLSSEQFAARVMAAYERMGAQERQGLDGRNPTSVIVPEPVTEPPRPASTAASARRGQSAACVRAPDLENVRQAMIRCDFEEALRLGEHALSLDPANSDAAACVRSCRATLERIYAARIGGLRRTPRFAPGHHRPLATDSGSAYLLSLLEDGLTFEEIVDVFGSAKLDVLRLLATWLDEGAISAQ